MKIFKNEFVTFTTTYFDVIGKEKYTVIRVAGEEVPVKYVKNKDDIKAMIHASFYAEIVEKALRAKNLLHNLYSKSTFSVW